MKFIVDETQSGQRLDKILTFFLTGYTRTYIQKIIKDKKVKVNKKVVQKSSVKLNINDKIEIKKIEPTELKIQPEKIALNVLYEDKNVLVINKPAGLVVHPADSGGNSSGTIVNAVLYHCKNELSGIGGVKRPGILHRLDKNTSGVLMIAKNDLTHQFLSQQIQERKVDKYYQVLIKGHIHSKKGSIDAPIFRSMKDRKKMAVSLHSKARNALTHYEVMEEFKNTSLLKVQIITGRTHQIRVHFASINYPVAGDDLYGDPKFNQNFSKTHGLKRQFLHAWKLGVVLPEQTKKTVFEAPLSNDLSQVLKGL